MKVITNKSGCEMMLLTPVGENDLDVITLGLALAPEFDKAKVVIDTKLVVLHTMIWKVIAGTTNK